MRVTYCILLPVLLSALSLACGGGGGKSSSAPVASFTVTPATLTLPVPPATNVDPTQNYYPSPYSGAVTLAVSRNTGFTGAITLSVNPAQLPSGVKAGFANATDATGSTTIVPASSNTATLSIQAGYPDPSDSTFTKQIYPAQGNYSVTINASATGSSSTTGSLALKLIQEPADFGLIFCDASGSTANFFTNINMVGPTLQEAFTAYWAIGTYTSPWGPVVLGTQGVPSGLTVSLDAYSATLNDVHTMTVTAQAGLQAGTYSFLLTGSYLGVTHTLPVVITYSPYPFSLQAPLCSTITVAQGQTLNFPLYLWHNDAYFGTTMPAAGTDPAYVGATNLSVSGSLPTGLAVGFTNADPTGLASVPLSITASPSTTTGSYTVNLLATRVGAGGVSGTTVQAAPLPLTVTVTSSSGSPTLWIQSVEWGQSVVAPNLRLVGGKPSLLRVHLLADRPGVAAPLVTATIMDQHGMVIDTRTLQGPANVPTALIEGDFPTVASASLSSYTAILPASVIQPGMQVTIQAAGLPPQSLSPSVDPGYTLNLIAVPIYCQGVAPVLPADSVMAQALTAFWPVQSVNITHRAPYTTSTVIPPPSTDPVTDTSGDGWFQLLLEMASLRIVDGSTANYYGFFNPGLPSNFTQSIVGISLLGEGTGIGIDVTTAGLFGNSDPTLDLATAVMIHEEGHAFNLNHAPAGGAGYPQLDYPYAGAATGTWGFDPASMTAYDPATHSDIMCYAPTTHWVSDWDYLSALGFMGENEKPPVSFGAAVASAAATEQWVVSGMVRPDGQVRLSPMLRVTCAPAPPKAGDLNLVLTSASATRTIPFAATQIPDLPAGYRHFAFTVPATVELTSAEVRGQGGRLFRRERRQNLATRTLAVNASVQDSSLVVKESSRRLHLEWDAQAHPFVNVFHEGTSRTTLGLNLTGGSADLSLVGLPSGGLFVVHYSDGLNAVVRPVARLAQP